VEAGAAITVVAPEVDERIAGLPDVTVARRRYERTDLDGARLVIVATGDPAVAAAVYRDAEAAGVWVNAADDPAHCSFTLPARIRRGDLLVTFSTGGRSPALAAWLRRRFAAELGPEYETLLEVLSEARDRLRVGGVPTEGPGWQNALDSGMLDLIREGRLAEAKERLQACLSSSSD
jgi:siroheme synthase-like protein